MLLHAASSYFQERVKGREWVRKALLLTSVLALLIILVARCWQETSLCKSGYLWVQVSVLQLAAAVYFSIQ